MTNRKQLLQQQMEETRARLSAKLDSLGIQVKTETADAVTDVVRHAARSLTSAFDIRHQLSRHPWLVLGGSAALGSLLLGRVLGRKKHPHKQGDGDLHSQSAVSQVPRPMEAHLVEPGSTAPASVGEASAWTASRQELSQLALHSLTNIVSALASRAIPVVVDRIVDNAIAASSEKSPVVVQSQMPLEDQHLLDELRRLQNDSDTVSHHGSDSHDDANSFVRNPHERDQIELN